MSTTQAALLEALKGVRDQARHPDYDWPICLSNEVDAAIAQAEAAALSAAEAAQPEPVDDRAEFERWAGEYGRVFRDRKGDGYAFPYTQEAWVGWQARARLTALPQPEPSKPLLLRGIGKINGDGWKDTTRVGETVYAWNAEKPEPYAPGQFQRLGNETWTASTEQYDFEPVPNSELPEVVESAIEELRAQIAELKRAPPQPAPIAAQAAPSTSLRVMAAAVLRQLQEPFPRDEIDLDAVRALALAAQAGPALVPLTDEQIDKLMQEIGRKIEGHILVPGVPMHGDWPVYYRAKVRAAIAIGAQAPASTRPADASISGQRVDMVAAAEIKRLRDAIILAANRLDVLALDHDYGTTRRNIADDWAFEARVALAAAPQAPAEPAAQAGRRQGGRRTTNCARIAGKRS